MKIPDEVRLILKEWFIQGRNGIFILGVKYDNQKILFSIDPEFRKFKAQVKKSMKEAGVDDEDTIKIVSLIQNNYQEFYPDNIIESDSTQKEEEKSNPTRSDITIQQWQITFSEKYADLKSVCEKNFKGLWHSMEFALSVLRILNIEGCSLPFAGIILGAPSSNKTLAIEYFRHSKHVYYTDNFTAKAFVSHNTAISKEELKDVDLLPRIKNKCLLSPELSSIFSKNEDNLLETLGILTRILDGHGYQSDSGAHGRRGYSGEYMFTMIGAAVDIPYKVHRHLSNLGPKLYFLRMPRSKKEDNEYLEMLESDDFKIRQKEVKEKVSEYLDWFDQYPLQEYKENTDLIKITFLTKTDDARNILKIIVRLGKLLSYLRGTVKTWNTENTQGSNYGYSTPTREEPDRAMVQLLNLAKGHALSRGRDYLTIEDIPMLIKVVLSTASLERVIIFDLLLASKGSLTTSQVSLSLGISRPTALKTMAELVALGVVSGDLLVESDGEENENQSNYGKSTNAQKTIILAKEFEWFLSDEFQDLREYFVPDGNDKYENKIVRKTDDQEIRNDNKDDENNDSVKKNPPHVEPKSSLLIENLDFDASISSPSSPVLCGISQSEVERRENENK